MDILRNNIEPEDNFTLTQTDRHFTKRLSVYDLMCGDYVYVGDKIAQWSISDYRKYVNYDKLYAVVLTDKILLENGFKEHVRYESEPTMVVYMNYQWNVEVITENGNAVSIRYFEQFEDDGYDTLFLQQRENMSYYVHEFQRSMHLMEYTTMLHQFKINTNEENNV